MRAAADPMRAAEEALSRAYQELSCRRCRAGVTYARRAAGSALSAAFAARLDQHGRSTSAHLTAFAEDDDTPPSVRAAARRLLEASLRPELAWLGAGPCGVADDAAMVLGWCRLVVEHERLHPLAPA